VHGQLMPRAPARAILVPACISLATLIGVFDYLTGPEISFSIFYLLPVSIAAWLGGRWSGIAVSGASAAVWLAAEILAGPSYSHPVILPWNAAVRLGFFTVQALVLSSLRNRIEAERALARTDPLTGAANPRHFYEVTSVEIERCRRYGHSIALAYLDCDDFKRVNDERGHGAGDELARPPPRSATPCAPRTPSPGWAATSS
jgi:hypothetical protein